MYRQFTTVQCRVSRSLSVQAISSWDITMRQKTVISIIMLMEAARRTGIKQEMISIRFMRNGLLTAIRWLLKPMAEQAAWLIRTLPMM